MMVDAAMVDAAETLSILSETGKRATVSVNSLHGDRDSIAGPPEIG